MRIAYLINTYPSPSHSFIRREIRALETLGVNVHRFSLRRYEGTLPEAGDRDEAELTEYVLERGPFRLLVDVGRAALSAPRSMLGALALAFRAGQRSGRGLGRPLAYLVEAACIANRCRDLGISHLHAHFGTNSATVAMLADALGGPSFSCTVHGPEEFDCPDQLMLDEKTSRARFMVAVSSFGRSQLSRWAALGDWSRLKVVHCGIEPAAFAEPMPLADGSARFVSIGRFVEQKGQLLLVEALARANAVLPGLHLTLVGDGELRADVEAAIAAHRLESQVTITGWVDEARVRAELAAAHVLVMPSFAEGLPMVIMEAMAAGRPVIATWVAGVPELVRPGETGWLVPAGDVAALSEAIVAASRTEVDRLEAMGAAGRVRALARHDINVQAARLAELFRDVTARPAAEVVPALSGSGWH